MIREEFIGTGVALVTPFDEQLNIDYKGLKKLIDHVSPHVNYLVVQGSTGESATTTPEEKQEILDFVVANNTQKLPVVFGIGGYNTQYVLNSLKEYNLAGVDAILSVSPAYNKPSQEGIYQHFMAIADASPLPIILYNVPGRTGSNMSSATTLRCAQHTNIIGIKEASGDMVQAMEIVADKPEDFLLISGDDMLTLPLIGIGGVGVISVMANSHPKHFKEIVSCGMNDKFSCARQWIFQLLELNPLMYKQSNPVGIKSALSQMNICGDTVRQPLLPASEELKAEIKAVMDKMTITD